MYIHFVSLHYIHPQPSPKSLTLCYFLEALGRQYKLRYRLPEYHYSKSRFMEKETNILIRLTPHDKEKIKQKAIKEGMTVSEFARKMLLNGEVIKVDPDDKKTLNGIANNLNQLTRLANQTHSVQPGTEIILKKLINEIRNAYRKR
jgi:hypothetical protein